MLAVMAMEPAGIELIRDFVNTNDVQGGQDELATPELLAAWLEARSLTDDGTLVDSASHARALAVREGIRALGLANNDEPIDAAQVDAMNEAARSASLTVAVTPGMGEASWRLRPASTGVDGFIGRVLGEVATAMADGSWSRVKACHSDTCRWLFYDHSRNRSGTWCSMAGCGSRMKARAYRARRRGSAATRAAAGAHA
jgi:predicted RNA-binding Zn ribbon-like protein